MVAVKARDVDSYLRRADPGILLFLVYGPDTGLVSERVKGLCNLYCQSPSDPFQLIVLDGDGIAENPGRLVEEARTIGLFGARRTLWIKPTTRNLVPAVNALLEDRPLDVTVILQAGDLGRSSPLRLMCERSPSAFTLPCYADGIRDLGELVDQMMRDGGTRIQREARETLIQRLGGDRLASRGEIEKLLLYCSSEREITSSHVEVIVGDVAATAMDQTIDAAFAGQFRKLEESFARLQAEGVDSGVLLTVGLRHTFHLLAFRQSMKQEQTGASFVETQRNLHFSRKISIASQLDRWSLPLLAKALGTLQDAIAQTRYMAGLKEEIARQAFWSLASAPRRAQKP